MVFLSLADRCRLDKDQAKTLDVVRAAKRDRKVKRAAGSRSAGGRASARFLAVARSSAPTTPLTANDAVIGVCTTHHGRNPDNRG